MTNEAPDLFAAYHALRADPSSTRAAYDALAQRARKAKKAWALAGETARAQQAEDVLHYISRSRPPQQKSLLTPEQLHDALKQITTRSDAAPTLRALWRRLAETRNALAQHDTLYDSDHDAFLDSEATMLDLAQQLGIDLLEDTP